MAPQQHSTPPPEHTDRTGLRSALWLPIFDELADSAVVARLAAEAEEAGWHGVFVWDHLRWRAPVRQVADPWITLAAVATATEHLRLGPMVTPLPAAGRPRVARETATLDRLSGGRLTLGVGLGSDRFGSELSKTGEQLDDRLRGQMLDEALEILTAAWSGAPVHHRGRHYTVEGIQFLPPTGATTWGAGVGRGIPRQRQAAAPGRPSLRPGRLCCCRISCDVPNPRWSRAPAAPGEAARGGSFGVGGLSRVLSGGGRSPTDPVDVD
jgi:alkanesulfonate monooxygenase SsuD/methylene tetrahydromethanopterin reductase-like flavin-dependent oxidoreductase (luciferase family)